MPYDEKDCEKDQKQTASEVRETWHQARTDAEVHSGKDKDTFDNFEAPAGSSNIVESILLFPARCFGKIFEK